MSSIRFIHAADLHLDSPFKGMTGLPLEQLNHLRESTFTAFAKLVDYACEEKVDFVLLVGDIYDGEDRSLRAQLKFQEGMEKLAAADIPVFISYGNHDHLSGRWTRFELPANVHLFDKDVGQARLQVRGNAVSIYGFSYKERHVREPMIAYYPVADDRDAYHIGMLHGSLAGDQSHAVYAPFTKGELLTKQYDYWALGHIHLRQRIHEEPSIVYPGNIQGRHRNEQGMKGFYDVRLSKTETALDFVPASALVFDRLEVSCAGIRHANEWLEACQEAFHQLESPSIIDLEMVNIDDEAAELFRQTTEEEWVEVLREVMDESEPTIWIQSISFRWPVDENASASLLLQPVLDKMDSWTEVEWKDVLQKLYQHPRTINYLDVLTVKEMSQIQEYTEKLLRTEFARMR